jgi:hypothetical protein
MSPPHDEDEDEDEYGHAGDGVMKYAVIGSAPCGGAIQVTVALPADPVAWTSYGTPGAPTVVL